LPVNVESAHRAFLEIGEGISLARLQVDGSLGDGGTALVEEQAHHTVGGGNGDQLIFFLLPVVVKAQAEGPCAGITELASQAEALVAGESVCVGVQGAR